MGSTSWTQSRGFKPWVQTRCEYSSAVPFNRPCGAQVRRNARRRHVCDSRIGRAACTYPDLTRTSLLRPIMAGLQQIGSAYGKAGGF
eukprot:350259-Chlamydomonas_euryale.AAC.5